MIILSIILFVILVVYIFGTKYELFNIRLEKATSFYNDYRNFIEGKDYLLTKNRKDKRLIPYVINTNCFYKKYRKCINKNKNSIIQNKKCEDDSFNSCVINMIKD